MTQQPRDQLGYVLLRLLYFTALYHSMPLATGPEAVLDAARKAKFSLCAQADSQAPRNRRIKAFVQHLFVPRCLFTPLVLMCLLCPAASAVAVKRSSSIKQLSGDSPPVKPAVVIPDSSSSSSSSPGSSRPSAATAGSSGGSNGGAGFIGPPPTPEGLAEWCAAIAGHSSWSDALPLLQQYYLQHGYGVTSRNAALMWEGGGLTVCARGGGGGVCVCVGGASRGEGKAGGSMAPGVCYQVGKQGEKQANET